MCSDDHHEQPNTHIRTLYHILPNLRVFEYDDDAERTFNVPLPTPKPHLSLKLRAWSLPLFALLGQLPTHLEVNNCLLFSVLL